MRAARREIRPAPSAVPIARDEKRSSSAQVLVRMYCDVELTGTVRLDFIELILLCISSVSLMDKNSLLGDEELSLLQISELK